MATRILTLFDEEDFSQEEIPAPKPAQPLPPADEPVNPGPVAHTEEQTLTEQPEIPETILPEMPEAAAKEPGPVPFADTDHTSAATETTTKPAPVAEPEEEIKPAAAISYEAPVPETAPVAAISYEAPVAEAGNIPEPQITGEEEAVKAADEELNKQIISELIQMDYTALIHKDYPFDLNKAQVITKKQPAPEPVAITEAEEEEQEEAFEEEETFEEIVPLPEWNLDKKYYTIGEVAQLFAVNTSHIRFWTNEFKLKPRTTRKGDRLYNPKDIAELRLIHHLVKEKKHTIKGAREKLRAEKSGVSDKLDLKESLSGLRDILLQIKEQL